MFGVLAADSILSYPNGMIGGVIGFLAFVCLRLSLEERASRNKVD
jgi:hypothetical protein